MNHYYILHPDGSISEAKLAEWAKWMFASRNLRRVAIDHIRYATVITEFIGADKDGSGALWETTVQGGLLNGYSRSYSSKDEAIDGHKIAVAKCQASDIVRGAI